MKYFILIPTVTIAALNPSLAEAKKFDVKGVKVDARINVDLQAAAVKTDQVDWTLKENLDWAARLKGSKNMSPKTQIGFVVKIDQDFDADSLFSMSGQDQNETIGTGSINRRLSFGYVKGKWGQLSAGNMGGQADRLSLHAPQIGTGQIRGDFSRYTGKSALLNAYNTQNAFKIDYVSPPKKPIIVGVSYAPKTKNRLTGEVRQMDAFEFGVQTRLDLSKDWSFKTSGAYVTSQSATESREGIKSYSLGGAFEKGRSWSISGAYVNRGDSDTRTGYGQTEINGGVRYRTKKWGVSASSAAQKSAYETRNSLGLGAEYKLSKNVRIRVDSVGFKSKTTAGEKEHGQVILTDLRVHY